MAERMPLTVCVRPDQLDALVRTLTPMQAKVFVHLWCWMAMNASALPEDVQTCCEIAGAKSKEARVAVVQLIHGNGDSNGYSEAENGVGNGYRNGDGRVFIRVGPTPGLTLRTDTMQGIDPVRAADAVEEQRTRVRDRVRRCRERKQLNGGNGYGNGDGHSDLAGALNSEIQNTEIQRVLLPSVVAHAVRARDVPTHVREAAGAEAPDAPNPAEATPLPIPSEVSPERVGSALKAMRSTGITGCNGANPSLLALLAMGVTDDELHWCAEDALARGKAFPYAVRAFLGARTDVAAPMPSGAPPRPSWVAQAEERTRAWMGPYATGWKPPE